MRVVFSYVNKFPTRFLLSENLRELEACIKFGKTPEPNCDNIKKLVVVIPGNPGVADFYGTFINFLSASLPSHYGVLVIGHAGHATPNSLLETFLSFWRPFSTDDQIQHKIQFLERYAPVGTDVILVGHSIGCFISLEIMKHFEMKNNENSKVEDKLGTFTKDKHKSEAKVELDGMKPALGHSADTSPVVHSYLLFPTIERMAETSNGRLVTKLSFLRWLVPLFAFWLVFIPRFFKEAVLRWYIGRRSNTEESVQASYQLLSPATANQFTYMGCDEMRRVKNCDRDLIYRHRKKIFLYYGSCDRWCPKQFYYDMKLKVVGVQAFLCGNQWRHAFVLGHSEVVAQMVSDLILKKAEGQVEEDLPKTPLLQGLEDRALKRSFSGSSYDSGFVSPPPEDASHTLKERAGNDKEVLQT
ncbi:unnamed protein product [Cyprideis torosa]|uniref:Lipid droplet-associated hydrolase n=1 Tax=Cyprideis torosa TaxID=163714 RepID=A0A7R8WLL5_9CRUS|nr:unnamed protein product [Cyprideis torosa]CAG0898334.1 unnamed protein product [Cyprideis torosa]